MAIQKFEDLIAWQKSQTLAVLIHIEFRGMNDLGFRKQIYRASVSISSNIAEGFDRRTNADFSRFLYIAIASCSEVKSLVYLAESLHYITPRQKNECLNKSEEVARIIRGLIKAIDPKANKEIPL